MAWPKKTSVETLSSMLKKKSAASRPIVNVSRSASGIVRIRHGYGTPEEWYKLKAEVHERDGGKCVSCGSIEHLHAHHLQRESRGGTLNRRNLITLCEHCHEQRHSHMHKHRK
jgi:5-methylcytosine-specific restriction endonuclease McrA